VEECIVVDSMTLGCGVVVVVVVAEGVSVGSVRGKREEKMRM
jgi:hypothetical protein